MQSYPIPFLQRLQRSFGGSRRSYSIDDSLRASLEVLARTGFATEKTGDVLPYPYLRPQTVTALVRRGLAMRGWDDQWRHAVRISPLGRSALIPGACGECERCRAGRPDKCFELPCANCQAPVGCVCMTEARV